MTNWLCLCFRFVIICTLISSPQQCVLCVWAAWYSALRWLHTFANIMLIFFSLQWSCGCWLMSERSLMASLFLSWVRIFFIVIPFLKQILFISVVIKDLTEFIYSCSAVVVSMFSMPVVYEKYQVSIKHLLCI